MRNFMRNTNKWVLALLLVVFAAGCGSDHGNTSSNEITGYSLSGTDAVVHDGVVTEGTIPKTIDVVMPFGTDLSQPLIATYTTTGASVMIDSVVQESGVTENVFLLDPQAPVIYTVTAIDGTTADYEVNVTVAASDAAVMTTFSIDTNVGIIDETAVPKTIDVVMPFGTNLNLPLTATFVATGDVKIDVTPQVSAVTPNDFTNQVTYTVTAADGVTTAIYHVNVTVAASDAAVMTTFSIDTNVGIIDETAVPKTIDVVMPFGTDLTALVATYATSPGASVMIDVTPQESALTPNDFTNQVIYTVTAADGVTTANYDVFVTVDLPLGPNTVNLGTAGDFAILAESGVTTTGTTSVTGDIGVSPAAGSTITGFGLTADLATNTFSTSSLVVGKVYAANDSPPTPTKMTTAVGDMHAAYTDAQTRVDPDFLNLHAGDIGGQTLVPGLYKYGTGLAISTDVTLTGGANDVWIIQIDQDLTVSNGVIVTLSGGAQAKNIFWQVAGQANLGTTADFKGIILCKTQIAFNTGAVLNGRALSQTQVTLDATTITEPAL